MTTPSVKTTIGEIKQFYDDPEEVGNYLKKRTAQPFNSTLHEREVDFLKKAIKQHSAARVLDLAPGPARLSAQLSVPGTAVAMDFSQNMLREARKRIAARGMSWDLVRGDAYQLPFATASFDLVYSLRFIRRFDRPHRELLYAEIRRVLRADGLFIMDAQNRRVALPHRIARGRDQYPVYDELFLRDELIAELEENDFIVNHLEGIMRRFTLQFRLNRLRRFYLSGPARLMIRALEHTSDENPSTWMALCQKSKV